MIIGNGLLAQTFVEYKDDTNFLIFASGVSNSSEVNLESFAREKELLANYKETNMTLVYFSSCDVIYTQRINKPYYFHKLDMENYILNNFERNVIFRIPQVIGYSTNKFSLINYFIDAILSNKELFIQQYAYKNLIDIDDVLVMANHTIKTKNIHKPYINLINKYYYSVLELVQILEDSLKTKAKIELKPLGFKPSYIWDEDFNDLELTFGANYIKNSILKHYGNSF